MGWYLLDRVADDKQQLLNAVSELFGSVEVLESHRRVYTDKEKKEFDLDHDAVSYHAAKVNEKGDVQALVILERFEGDMIDYKPYTESSGPGECECPESILDKLTPTDNEYAKEWRDRAYALLIEKELASRTTNSRGAVKNISAWDLKEGDVVVGTGEALKVERKDFSAMSASIVLVDFDSGSAFFKKSDRLDVIEKNALSEKTNDMKNEIDLVEKPAKEVVKGDVFKDLGIVRSVDKSAVPGEEYMVFVTFYGGAVRNYPEDVKLKVEDKSKYGVFEVCWTEDSCGSQWSAIVSAKNKDQAQARALMGFPDETYGYKVNELSKEVYKTFVGCSQNSEGRYEGGFREKIYDHSGKQISSKVSEKQTTISKQILNLNYKTSMETNQKNDAVKKSLPEIKEMFGQQEKLFLFIHSPEKNYEGKTPKDEMRIVTGAIAYNKETKERVFINDINFNGKVAEDFKQALAEGNRNFTVSKVNFRDIREDKGFDKMDVVVNKIESYAQVVKITGDITKAEAKDNSSKLLVFQKVEGQKDKGFNVVVKNGSFEGELKPGQAVKIEGNLSTVIKENGYKETTLWPDKISVVEKQSQAQSEKKKEPVKKAKGIKV